MNVSADGDIFEMSAEEYLTYMQTGGPGVAAAPRAPHNRHEDDMVAAICRRARLLGWEAYHTLRSQGSEPGFPDIILVRGAVQLVIEAKWADGHYSPDQERWLAAFAAVPASQVIRVRGGAEPRMRFNEVSYDAFLDWLDALG